MVNRELSRIPYMKYYHRIEYIESLKKRCFIESIMNRNHKRDLLAVREDQVFNFKDLFYLDKHEKESYNRIIKWIKENYPEYLI